MTYPDYPNNRLIVNDVDLSIRFRLFLLDGFTLSPPEPKTYTVDIPGGDGVIDLTESLTGDVAYNNREMEFTFVSLDVEDYEYAKTRLSNFLHGKEYDFKMTMDPDYTYHGRFSVESYSHTMTSNHGVVGTFTVKVSANPYKTKGKQTYRLNATGGVMFRLESGRKPVHPVIESDQPCHIRYGNVITDIGAGTYHLNKILFHEGMNEIYINSYRFWNVMWKDFGENKLYPMTWNDAKTKRWDDLQRLDSTLHRNPQKWSDVAHYRWSDMSTKHWYEVDTRKADVPETNVYVQYEWKDL